MIPPTEPEIRTALRVLNFLRQQLDANDDREARQQHRETSQEMHQRMTQSRIVERLASVDESIVELRQWAQKLQPTQDRVPGYRHSV